MWDLSSQTSDQTVLPALEAKVSAQDSQGGPSPRPCPGVPGLSRFTPPPQHRLSSLSPCSARPECPHTDAASSGSSVTCPKLLLRSPPCRVPALCLSLGPAPSSHSPHGLGTQQLTPISPNSADTGTVWGRVTSRGVRSGCPRPAMSDPLTTRRKAPNSTPGSRARDFSFQGVSTGTGGSETA